MKKKHLIGLLIILLLSNIVTLYFSVYYYNKYNNFQGENTGNIFILNGENTNWKLTNGILIITKHKVTFNSDSLEYIGTEPLKIQYVSVTISNLAGSTNSNNNMLFSVIHQTQNKNINLLNNNKILLGTSTQYTKVNNLKASNGIIVKLEYKTELGENRAEQFDLNTNVLNLDNSQFHR